MIQIDYWGGDLHQTLVESSRHDSWLEACRRIKAAVESGLLVNVLHTDFKAPPERLEEQRQLLAKQL